MCINLHLTFIDTWAGAHRRARTHTTSISHGSMCKLSASTLILRVQTTWLALDLYHSAVKATSEALRKEHRVNHHRTSIKWTLKSEAVMVLGRQFYFFENKENQNCTFYTGHQSTTRGMFFFSISSRSVVILPPSTDPC